MTKVFSSDTTTPLSSIIIITIITVIIITCPIKKVSGLNQNFWIRIQAVLHYSYKEHSVEYVVGSDIEKSVHFYAGSLKSLIIKDRFLLLQSLIFFLIQYHQLYGLS